MKILVLAIFSLFLVFGEPYAQAAEDAHEPHPHKHKQYAKVKNPMPLTERSISKGRKLYEKHCISCHGEGGKGSGNIDLTDGIWIHGDADGEIFHVITDGAKETSMRGFKKDLTKDMRWHLVNYIKSLKGKKKSNSE